MFVCICIVWFIWWIYTACLRKFSKFGFWKLFSKFGFCLKTIQNVLNLFLKISLNCFFDTVFVHFFDFDLKLSLNSPLKNIWKRVSKIVWNLFENLQNVFKTFQNISKSCLKNFKHWEVNNLQLLDQLTIVKTS